MSNDPFEAERERVFGPPAERELRNHAYVAKLTRAHTEPELRAMLEALARHGGPRCGKSLRDRDLARAPLTDLIGPHDMLGMSFAVRRLKDGAYRVELGEAWGDVGSGGTFVLRGDAESGFAVEEVETWIA